MKHGTAEQRSRMARLKWKHRQLQNNVWQWVDTLGGSIHDRYIKAQGVQHLIIIRMIESLKSEMQPIERG